MKGASGASRVLQTGMAAFRVYALMKDEAEQAPGVDRPPSSLSYATLGSLPATQGQR